MILKESDLRRIVRDVIAESLDSYSDVKSRMRHFETMTKLTPVSLYTCDSEDGRYVEFRIGALGSDKSPEDPEKTFFHDIDMIEKCIEKLGRSKAEVMEDSKAEVLEKEFVEGSYDREEFLGEFGPEDRVGNEHARYVILCKFDNIIEPSEIMKELRRAYSIRN